MGLPGPSRKVGSSAGAGRTLTRRCQAARSAERIAGVSETTARITVTRLVRPDWDAPAR